MGAAVYMAPEVFTREYSKSADMWSLGMMLYQFMSCRFPFWCVNPPISSCAHVLCRLLTRDFHSGVPDKICLDTCPQSIACSVSPPTCAVRLKRSVNIYVALSRFLAFLEILYRETSAREYLQITYKVVVLLYGDAGCPGMFIGG